MNTYIKDYRIEQALRELATNLISIADIKLPMYKNLQVAAFFSVGRLGERRAEIIAHGIDESKLRTLVEGCNSYSYKSSMTIGTKANRVPTDKIMPYVVLCNDKSYYSTAHGRMVTFS